MKLNRFLTSFISSLLLVSVVSCASPGIIKPKEAPVVTFLVNGETFDTTESNDIGEYFIKDKPNISYIVDPDTIASNYVIYKDDSPVGTSIPKEVGSYKYEVTTRENNTHKSITAFITFSLKENPDHVIYESAPTIRVTTNYTDESTKNRFATWPNRNNKASWYDTDCNVSVSCVDSSFNANNLAGQIRVRGNYTSNYTKKPFRIKFSSKTNLLGLNNGAKFKKWCLLADVKDSAMMRNMFSFHLGRKLLNQENLYTSDCTPVHLYLNDEYWGMYLLCEQQEVKSNRVNIEEPDEGYEGTDIGYFFEYDGYYSEEQPVENGGDPTFTMNYRNGAQVKNFNGANSSIRNQYGFTIKSDITNNNQITFLKSQVEKIYDIMYFAGTQNKAYMINENNSVVESQYLTPKEAVERVINLPSLVDTYIMNEIACNLDIDWSSFYMSLDMSDIGDHKLTFQAPWDWDSCYGVRTGLDNISGSYVGQKGNPWLKVLLGADWFKALIKEKLQLLKNNGVFDRIFTICEEYVDNYEGDYASNYIRWPRHIGANSESGEVVSIADTFTCQRDAYNYFKSWTQNRINDVYGLFDVDLDDFSLKAEEFKKNAINVTRYEAEDSINRTGQSIKISRGNNSSNSAYLGGLANTANQTFSFNVNSAKNVRALVVAGLSARSDTVTFKSMFSLEVNGNIVNLPTVKIPGVGSAFDWHNWTECYVAFVDLAPGDNILKFITTTTAINFDYIDIYY